VIPRDRGFDTDVPLAVFVELAILGRA